LPIFSIRLTLGTRTEPWSASLSQGFTRSVGAAEAAVDRLKKIGREIANLFGSDSTMWGLVAFTGALAARLKKSANPLVDTGRKHQSVTYVVEV